MQALKYKKILLLLTLCGSKEGESFRGTRGDAIVKRPARRWMWLWWGIILGLLGAVPAQGAVHLPHKAQA